MNNDRPQRLMLMFTIGPVQSFIAAARKTEDLWMGSYILSYLAAIAIDNVRGGDVELIYPAIGAQSPFAFWRQQDFSTPSLPNLFLAIGDGIDVSHDELVKRAKKAEKSVKAEFRQMAECVVDEAFGKDKWRWTYVGHMLERQTSDFLNVCWVITEEAEQGYQDWYARTAASLAAAKNCRPFTQSSEFGRKCSLDGTHEILHLQQDESVSQAMKWWQDFADCNPQHCRQREALGSVSLTKRMGRHFLNTKSEFKDEFSNDRPSFPSTSEVATADFKDKLRSNRDALDVYKRFVKQVRNLRTSNNTPADVPTIQPLPKVGDLSGNENIDGDWLYEETWTEPYLKRYHNIDARKEKEQIQICKGLRQDLIRLLGGEPGRYYAAIALDGDNMGEMIREAQSQAEHTNLSHRLIQYTGDTRQIVEQEHLGKLTYAGGDDLLALSNLRDLLPTLKRLRAQFPDFTTASAGVCIAHNKTPLGDVLQQARRMEKVAKDEGQRDALGIALFKRSGNISSVVTKWKHRDLDVLAVSEDLIRLLLNDEVSKRFLYNFRETFARLIEDEDDCRKLGRHLIQTEFNRIVERAHAANGTLPERSQQTIESLAQLVYDIQPFSHLLGYLEIVNFIARQPK
ncbi:MAG: type III-B CRISPR-associated protein Cas10/Cmr2 [Caldilineaceae bacterium]|nr:type III-B CRISPR-associated protein Cas10/Cmr2 [Caldilineaceae bacterium]